MKRLFLVGLLLAFAANASAELIDVDFNAGTNGNAGDPGVNASGAAAIGTAGDTWNAANPESSGPIALVNSAGGATAVTMSWSASDAWNISSNNSPNPALTNDFLFATDVHLANVPAGTYDLYLYCSDDVNQNGGRSTGYSVNGSAVQTVVQFTDPSNWDNAQADANNHGNYTLFSSISPAGGVFDITLDGTRTINGLQLISVPEPSSVILFGLGVVGLLAVARRRRSG